ncbi:MAG: hypothetical protein IPP71_08355 [Bacteroidetes bacterium]|nr:hypothetical protein [Bacteroidota bacterium]
MLLDLIDEIILFYPDTVSAKQDNHTELTIKDSLADGKEISIKAFQLPIINKELLSTELNPDGELKKLFEPTRQKLIEKIEQITLPKLEEN